MNAAVSRGQRYDFLDWLRVIAILVLLFFHTGMLFVGWGWHVVNGETIRSLELPMDLAHRLRMPLLFVIAGAGMWFALERRSLAGLVRERTLRLLLPLIAGMFLIVPPQIYFERLQAGQWSGGYLEFYVERVLQFQPYPNGNFSWHHLWFIAYLFVYVLLLLPAMQWWKHRERKPAAGVWLWLLAVPLALNEAVLRPLFPERHTLVNDWYIFNHYLLLTVYGFILASMPGAWEWFAAQRRRALVAVVVIIGTALPLFELGIIHRDTALDSCIATTFTWFSICAFLGYGHRYLSFANPLLVWARDASYPIYILHQTLIVAIGYYVVQLPWAPWTKYWAVLGATMVSCYLIYELIVRRFGVTRLIFGMKPRGAVRAATADAVVREA